MTLAIVPTCEYVLADDGREPLGALCLSRDASELGPHVVEGVVGHEPWLQP